MLLFILIAAASEGFAQTPPTPTITVIGSNSVCPSPINGLQTVTLVSSSPSGNVWSNGQTTQTVYVSAGTYSVVVTNGSFYSAYSAPITVAYYNFPHIYWMFYAGPYCRDTPPVQLQAFVNPSGGFFSGPGLSGSIFTPANANLGDNNIIIYQYTQMFGSVACHDTAYMRIRIDLCENGIEQLEGSASGVSLYQQPGGEIFRLHAASQNIIQLQVTDLEGRRLMTVKSVVGNDLDFALEDYPRGLYIAEVQLKDRLVRVRFVKTD